MLSKGTLILKSGNTHHGTLILKIGTLIVKRNHQNGTLILSKGILIIKRNTHLDIGGDIIIERKLIVCTKGTLRATWNPPLFHRILIERNPHISSSIDTTGLTVMQVRKHLVETLIWKQKRAKTLKSSVCTLHYMNLFSCSKMSAIRNTHFIQNDIMRNGTLIMEHEIQKEYSSD